MATENGDVWADRKNAKKRRLVVVNATPNPEGNIELKNEGTEIRNFISAAGLEKKFKLVGRYIPQGGEAVFVPLEKIGSAPEIEATRTEDPPDPPLTEKGVEPVNDNEVHTAASDQTTEIATPEGEADHEYVLALLLLGQLRKIDTEFKNKEGRLMCPCGGAHLLENGTAKEMVEQLCGFIVLHWRHVSPMPKPGEVPYQGHLTPRNIPETTPNADTAAASEPDKAPEEPVPSVTTDVPVQTTTTTGDQPAVQA